MYPIVAAAVGTRQRVPLVDIAVASAGDFDHGAFTASAVCELLPHFHRSKSIWMTLPLRPEPTLDFIENILHLLFPLSCNIPPALTPGFQAASPLNSHSTLSSQPSLGFGTALSQVKTPRVEPCFFYVNTPFLFLPSLRDAINITHTHLS
jgi:hypothetical protein